MSETVKTVKRRIRSAKNIKQITKAMEMVSASKMRRSQDKALTTRPYSIKIRETLASLSNQIKDKKHPMLAKPDPQKGSLLIILISSDRGLCGALNSNLFRAVEEFKDSLSEERGKEILTYEFVAVGKKSREYVLKTGQLLHAEFTHLPEYPRFEDILPITRIAIEGFNSERYSEVYIIYTDFISTLKQEVNSLRLIPIDTDVLKDVPEEKLKKTYRDYIFEPKPEIVVEDLLPHYIEMQCYQTFLEAQASENSARMVAMRNASENASEVIDDLTLVYNKKRQQSITNEISDLITSRMAVS